MRVIAGDLKGRRLHVPAGKAVRPTPDRVRETLFNWLQGEVAGAAVLDLFAGSGALAIEALSRGADSARLVEQDRGAVAALRANVTLLAAPERVHVDRASAWSVLERPAPGVFHLVFLDPPYGRGWPARAAAALEAGGWLAADARIYVEAGTDEPPPEMPAAWCEDRSGRCGDVAYRLYRRSEKGGPTGD